MAPDAMQFDATDAHDGIDDATDPATPAACCCITTLCDPVVE